MGKEFKFTVYGHPEPKGSTRAFIPKGWKRPVITSANKKGKPWAQEISRTASEVIGAVIPFGAGEPVAIKLHFFFMKPKSTSKHVVFQAKRPDVDKLCRLVNDSLTGIAYVDDAQICRSVALKDFGSPERVEITLRGVTEHLTPEQTVVV